MAVRALGRLSVGQCLPALARAVASAAGDLTAKITGIAQLQASVTVSPPTIAAQIQVVTALLATLQAQLALALALGLPEVSIDLTVMLGLLADLNAQLALLITLQQAMATAGVTVLVADSQAQSFGSEMQVEVSKIAPSGNAVQAVTFLATEPAVFEALGKVLLTG